MCHELRLIVVTVLVTAADSDMKKVGNTYLQVNEFWHLVSY